jgi:hypothetical protein
LDPVGAFHFIALDDDWNKHPQNVVTTLGVSSVRARPTIRLPTKPAVSAGAPTFARFVYDMGECTKWEKARTAIHATIVTSLDPANDSAINATHAAGISSLSCKQLVEYMAQKSEVTTDETSLVETALHTPLTYFADFPDFMATLKMSYTFLGKIHYVLPPLMLNRLLTEAIQAFPQFQGKNTDGYPYFRRVFAIPDGSIHQHA